jgi:hypothetical protein
MRALTPRSYSAVAIAKLGIQGAARFLSEKSYSIEHSRRTPRLGHMPHFIA